MKFDNNENSLFFEHDDNYYQLENNQNKVTLNNEKPQATFQNVHNELMFGAPETNGVGTNDHTKLTNRDKENQHPIKSITGLQDALNNVTTIKDVKVNDLSVVDEQKVANIQVPNKLSELENDSFFVDKTYVDNEIKNIDIPDVDLSNYYDKSEVDAKFNEIPETDLSDYYNKEEVDNKIENIDIPVDKFVVTYDINFQTLEILNLSHYSEEIINAYNEGKQIIFNGTVLGMGMEVPGSIGFIQGNTVFSYPIIRLDMGEGAITYLVTISVFTDSESLEMVQLKEDTGEENTEIFNVTYNINPQDMSITYISNYSADIINAHNEGKQVRFIGNILGMNVPVISYLTTIQGNSVKTFTPFRFDLGAGMANLLVTVTVDSNSANLEMTQLKEDTGEEEQENIFTVNYTLNPQDMTVVSQSHYSGEIIQAFNEGKKVTFRGYVLGLNVYVNSELQLVDGEYAFTYPLLRINLGEGEKNYLFKVQISSDSSSVEMNEIGEGSGTDDTIFLVEYNVNLTNKQVTYVSKTQQDIVNAYNEGKKVMFRGTVTGSNTTLISELNTVDSGIPYTYPFLRTDLGEGIYNYFFRIGVYREFGTFEAYAFVDTNRLKKTEDTFNQTLSNIANSRPTTDMVQAMVNYFIHEGFLARENRLLPENAEEGTILKYVDGKWTAVEDDTFTVEYTLNPQTMSIESISHYSEDIISAYNNGQKVVFKCFILGLEIYVDSELRMVNGNSIYTYPILRGDLGMGMMTYLIEVAIRTSSTNVGVYVLQEVTNNVVENLTIGQIEELNVSDLEEKTVKEVEE